jgi:hypothetical protein
MKVDLHAKICLISNKSDMWAEVKVHNRYETSCKLPVITAITVNVLDVRYAYTFVHKVPRPSLLKIKYLPKPRYGERGSIVG